jgi:hypothetical protein
MSDLRRIALYGKGKNGASSARQNSLLETETLASVLQTTLRRASILSGLVYKKEEGYALSSVQM